MGSLADELSAGVEGGWVRRRELGEYMKGKGFQDSAVSRALGTAVKKWGSLARVELLSDIESRATEEGYVSSYEGVGKLLLRRQPEDPSKFVFGPKLAYLKGMAKPFEYFPLFVDVTALDYAPNCKAKVAVFPPGVGASPHGQEVQAYWQPGDKLAMNLNAGESAMVELSMIHCSVAWQHTWHSGQRDITPVCFVRTPEARSGMGEDWYEMNSTVNVLVLTIYSANFFCYFPFLFRKRRLTRVEMVPIVGYASKGVNWSGKGLYSSE